MIIPYPTVKLKHILQVYVTNELKIKLFCFFTIRAIVRIFHSHDKQIFKSFSSTKIRRDSKWTKTSQYEVMQPTTSNKDSWPIFLTMSTTRQVFTIPLWTEEALFTWAFRRWVSFFKYLQEFKVVVYQLRQLERVTFDYTHIIAGSRKSCFKAFQFKCL